MATLSRTEQKATIAGSLVGGLAGAAVIYAAFTPLYLRYMALVLGIGPGSKTRGVIAFVAVAALFGALFGAFAARHAGTIGGNLIALAKSNALTRSLLGPFFRRAPLTTTTTLMGLTYGAILGLLVGRIAVPELVIGATPFSYELSRTAAGPVFGFVVFGGVLGVTYGRIVEHESSLTVGSGTLLGNGASALVFGPLVGAAAGAATFLVLVPGHLASLALIAGVRPTPVSALAVWGILSFLLALVFVFTAARTVSKGKGYVKGVTSAGFAYGVILAVGLGMLVVPYYATQLTEWTIDVPNTNLGIIIGYIVYGTALGAAYGSAKQSGSVLPRVVRDHRDAVVFSSLLGGFLGGSIVYQAGGDAQLLFYGSLVGYAGSVPRSWAVWMGLTFLLGVFFVRYVRPRDESEGYLWRSTRRGLGFGAVCGIFVGGILVPALVSATTTFDLPVPYLNPMVVIGYTLFGGVIGAGYGASFEEHGLAVGAKTTKGVVFGSLLGGLMGGLVIHHLAGPVYIQFVGSLFGVGGSVAKSWATWLIVSLVFGAGFARVVASSIDAYVDSMLSMTENNPDLRAFLQPLMERAALTTTATSMGLAYGAVLALVVGALALPLLVSATTPFTFPFEFGMNLAYLFGFVVYGGFLGAGYGAMVEF
ncbi:hypothetical protein [Halorarius litoreus]|uniref:hypothetical protein n=1 Tax=Halorarius litoreus TaxID=2962676 RepID=UPI0020CB9B3E|nr:hypothetical protein [Halorarius litoreus]